MKRTLIITLLLLVAAFSFGQTNSTFNNLDVRNTTKLRGLIYPFGAVATSPINTAVHEIAMINNTTFALCRMDFKEFADSIANYLNPIIGSHWERTGNYLYPITLSDSVGIGTDTPIERLDVQDGNINLDTTSATSGQITQNGETVFHTYSSNPNRQNLWIGGSAGNFTTTGTWNLAIGQGALMSATDCERNLAIGYNAMYNTTGGSMNLAIGRNSLKNNTNGYYNLAIGEGTLEYNTSGQFNLAIGNDALNGNIGNHGSLAIGYNAMYYADDRSSGRITYNTAIGFEAMKGSSTAANNTGQYNTAVGYQALLSNTSGYVNTAVGKGALYSNTTGNNNNAVGYHALYVNTIGVFNNAFGYYALGSNTEGGSNSAFGDGALHVNTLGSYNCAFGDAALNENKTGNQNTAIGSTSLFSDSTGSYNTAIGYGALAENWNGSGNIAIGFQSGYNETGSNKLYIENSNADSTGALIFGNFATDALTINGDLTVTGYLKSGTGSIADNDSTPSVASYNTFIYAGSANPVSIDALDDHVVGCYYTIIGNSNTYTITVIDGTPAGGDSFNLAGGNWVGGSQDVLLLYCIAADAFIEVSRSNN